MGAFFLYKKDAKLDLKDVIRVFKEKGFDGMKIFDFGTWILWHYPKQLMPELANYYMPKKGRGIFVTGTVTYKGKGYADSLKTLLDDFVNGWLDKESLVGNFCLIFRDGKRLSLFTDSFNVHHIFFDEKKQCVSTSFLAILAASKFPRSLNRLAMYEKLCTGYIVSPDTLAEGIFKLNDALAERFSFEKDGLSFIKHDSYPPIELHRKGLDDSIARQVTVLDRHFAQVRSLHREFKGELGLSSGYDSRLLLACARGFSPPLSLHTHLTVGVHEAEARVAEKMAEDLKLQIKTVPTKPMEEYSPSEVERIMRDGLYYFDGRCSLTMGAYSPTYTREYKLDVLGDNRFSLNGLGGEIFRNSYLSNRGKVNMLDWMLAHVYYPFSHEIAGKALFEEMHRRKMEKASAILHDDFTQKSVNFLMLRRYYGEIMMPECDAINNDAHNQVAFYHTPFMDPWITREGLNATPYIGVNGVYQAKLIKTMAPGLAGYPTHYGHTFSRLPLKYFLKYRLREIVPDRVCFKRNRWILKKKAKTFLPKFTRFVEETPYLLKIKAAIEKKWLKDNFNLAMLDYAQRPTTLFVGSFLFEFQYKIKE